MLYQGMSVYARDLIGLPEVPFAQGLNKLITFRQIVRKGKGLGNLMLTDWTNQLIYGLLNVRSYEGNRAVIAKSREQIALIDSVWEDWAKVKSVFEQEFQIKLDYQPMYRIIEEDQVANRIELRFETNHPIGSKISYLGNSLRENGIVDQINDKFKKLDEVDKTSQWKIAMCLFLLGVTENGVYGDVISRKYELNQFCAYLLLYPEIVNLTIEQKSQLDRISSFKAPLVLSEKDNKYGHGTYGPFIGLSERVNFWGTTNLRRGAFQVGKPLDNMKMYVLLKGIFFL